MNGRGFIEWIVSGEVPVDSGSVSVVFSRPMPAWAWLLVAMAAVAIAMWSYRRLQGATKSWRRALRVALVVLRASVLLLLALLISGPSARFERTRVEPDRLVVLVDRSRSLSISDAPGKVTREQQLTELLRSSEGMLGQIALSKEIDFVGFSGGAFSLAVVGTTVADALGAAEGERTDIDAALRQALTRRRASR